MNVKIWQNETMRRLRYHAGTETAAERATLNRIRHRMWRYTR